MYKEAFKSGKALTLEHPLLKADEDWNKHRKMMLEIIKYSSSILRDQSLPIEEIDKSIKKLILDMSETMYAAPGVGLAAPQVGVSKRIVVIDIGRDQLQRKPIVLINPVITSRSEELVIGEEGCLSIPEVYADVKRSKSVEIKFINPAGKEREMIADDFLARVIQHEVDHLDGILFIDHLSRIKRDLIKMKLRKKIKLVAQGPK